MQGFWFQRISSLKKKKKDKAPKKILCLHFYVICELAKKQKTTLELLAKWPFCFYSSTRLKPTYSQEFESGFLQRKSDPLTGRLSSAEQHCRRANYEDRHRAKRHVFFYPVPASYRWFLHLLARCSNAWKQQNVPRHSAFSLQ